MRKPRFSSRRALTLAGLLFAAAGSPLQAQDFEGVFTSRAKGMPEGATMKTFVKDGKYRMEVLLPGQGPMTIIADPSVGETYMVMPSQQMYMVMKLADAGQVVDSLVRRNTSGEASLVATGRKEEIAGHACEWYQFKDESTTTDICMASGLGRFRGAEAMFGGGPGRSGMTAAPHWARELLRKGAVPLKVVDASGAVIWEVTAIEKKPLEASLFKPPANFRRMEMPGGRPPG